MSTTPVDAFVDAARDVDAAVTRTDAATFTDTLGNVVTTPAVGTPLPFDGLSYEDTPVDAEPTGADLGAAATGVTAGRLAIADYGSVVLEESGAGEELLGLYPDHHVVVVAASDVVADMPAAFETLEPPTAGSAIIATGPSATADMGSLVTGVHGPREVTVLLVEDR